MRRRSALVCLICSAALAVSDGTSLAVIQAAAKPCPSGPQGKLFHFRQRTKDPSVFRLPLKRSHARTTLAKTIFAITAGGESLPLTLQKVFVRPLDPAKQCPDRSPEGPEFGDEDGEILSCSERATAQYGAQSTPVGGIAFLSHDASDSSRIYRVTGVKDRSLRTRIEGRLRLGNQHGLVLTEATAWACQDKPTVQTFRFEGAGGSFVYYESDCTGWASEAVDGARFVALYQELEGTLSPVFSTRRASEPLGPNGYPVAPRLTEFIRIDPLFAADLDGDGLIETRLERSGGVSGNVQVVEFHLNGYERIASVEASEEGMPQPWTPFADTFLTCRP
jgi:hypothetical protein